MNNLVIGYLNKQGYQLPKTDMYNRIGEWEKWYINEIEGHKYKDSFGKEREMYTLGLAKRLCEDWASITFTEKDEIITDRKSNNKYVQKLIEKINLNDRLPEDLERASWSGTCAAIYRLKNIIVKNEKIIRSDKTTIDLISVTADKIIPLKIEHGKIIDCAFVSDTIVEDKKAIYIEIHQLLDEGYQISNIYLDAEKGIELENKDVIKTYNTGSTIPLFSILKTPILNPIEDNLGLGLSMYGNATDQLMNCDIAYHNFVMDFYLGGKKIFYNKKLIKYRTENYKDKDGNESIRDVPIYPDDLMKQQFMEVGDADLNNDKELIHEYNPELRVEDNQNGIQFALDLLSFKAGLGTKYYEFNNINRTVVTATQYNGERQDLMKNAKKYRNNLDKYVKDIIKAGLLIARVMFGEKVDENCKVMIENRDGLLVTDEEIKEQLRQEYNMGLISKLTYLMKINNWTEEEAREEIQRIKEEDEITSVTVKEGV